MMQVLTIYHTPEYHYAYPVAFGEHRIMLRPREGHDLRVLSNNLEIIPKPASLRWIHDVFGNSVGIATFEKRAASLSFTSTASVEHSRAGEFASTGDDPAYFYPFLYEDEEFPILPTSQRRNMAIRRAALGIGAKLPRSGRADADV